MQRPAHDSPAAPDLALTAVWGLVRVVPTVILCVTLPPEGDALVVPAHKLEGRWEQEELVEAWGLRGFSSEGLACFKEAVGLRHFGGRLSWLEGWDTRAGRPGQGKFGEAKAEGIGVGGRAS